MSRDELDDRFDDSPERELDDDLEVDDLDDDDDEDEDEDEDDDDDDSEDDDSPSSDDDDDDAEDDDSDDASETSASSRRQRSRRGLGGRRSDSSDDDPDSSEDSNDDSGDRSRGRGRGRGRGRDDDAKQDDAADSITGEGGSGRSRKGYRFDLEGDVVINLRKVSRGRVRSERIEAGETWEFNDTTQQLVQTEIYQGGTEVKTFADPNGDGIFTRISETFTPFAPSSTPIV